MAELTIQQAFELAVAHHQAGRWADAERIYRLILTRHPDFAEVHGNLGNIMTSTGRFDQAILECRRAIALKSDLADAHANLATALKIAGQLDQAIDALRQAIALRPAYAEAHYNLGVILAENGQIDQAIAEYRQATALSPHFVQAHNNLALSLSDQGQLDEALAEYDQALALEPQAAEIYNNLGNSLKDAGRLDEAIAAFSAAIALRPNFLDAHNNLVYALHFHPDYDAGKIAEELCRWNRQHAGPGWPVSHANDRSPDRRLRIGYVSPHFREHATTFFTYPLLASHDRERFEIYCYCDVLRPDQMTDKLKSVAEVWRPVRGKTDEQIVEIIRKDRIDILVDLTMHMGEARPLLFVRKPAPVQVAWLAYPGSTGLATMDYRLTDPYLDPPGLNDAHYSETSWRLPDTALCYNPMTAMPKVNALPALANGHITFGSLNNFCKANDRVLELWAAALAAVPDSRMLVLAPQGSHRGRLEPFARAAGVDPQRVEYLDRVPRPQYLEYFHRIDIVLDAWPYNGETTSLDGLWMGVPMVTLCGQTAPSRAGLCYHTHLGLTDLVAHAPAEYVRIAARLAGDLPRLAELRSTLRGRMERSPLMDGPRFARNVEAAYRQMWRKWCDRSS